MKEALYYEKLAEQSVRCHLCPHNCLIKPGQRGVCKVRENFNGVLKTHTYGKMATSPQMDPIEKKPLYHFFPGSNILSVAPNGCNLTCRFCQNWSISQALIPTQNITPEQLVETALRKRSVGIAYTYTEPFLWYEFLMEAAPLAREKGLKNVMVTNGFHAEKPFLKLLPLIDAFNIDLKSMADDFYRHYCGARVQPVLNTIKIAAAQVHVELTNLVIPTLNDSDEQIDRLVSWVVDELGVDVPLHFSRYFPCHQLSLPPTPVSRLFEIRTRALPRLRYVYLGNIGTSEAAVKADSTYCPHCQKPLITRVGYYIEAINSHDGYCDHCSEKVNIVQ